MARTALAVGAFATTLRLIWVALMSRPPVGLSDLTLYVGFARHIADGRGYISLGRNPTAYYPPGYPYFLGAIQWVLDRVGLGSHLVLATGVIQAFLGGLSAALVVLLGYRLGAGTGSGSARRGRRIGVTAGLVLACWPNLIVYSSLMLSETLFIAAFMAMLLAIVTIDDPEDGSPVASRVVVAAFFLGVCTLIRPQSTLLVAPGIVAVWLFSHKGWRWTLKTGGALALGVLLLLTPWIVRNAVQLNAFIPVSTNTGDNLCIGFNPDSTGGFMLTDHCETGEKYIDSTAAEVRRDRANRSAAISWALSNPGRLPGLSLDKLRLTFRSDADGMRALESFDSDPFLGDTTRTALRVVSNSYYYVFVALAVIGAALVAPDAFRSRRTDSTALLLLMVTFAGAVIPVISFGDTRFKLPLAPCFALFAALAMEAAISARWQSGIETPSTSRPET